MNPTKLATVSLAAVVLAPGTARAGGPPQEELFQEAALLALDGAEDDELGFAIAMDGDLLAVGAPKHGHAGLFQSGAVYVYRRVGTDWTFEAELAPASAALGDRFGKAVDVQGDTIAVGAPMREAGGLQDAGAVFVFELSGTTWQQRETLSAQDAGAFDHLGTAVALSGDTLAVGAPFDDDGGAESGSTYVFRRAGTSWSQEAKLGASNAEGGDRFGKALDVDGARLLVGAEYGQGGAVQDSGAAYVFERSGTTWSETAVLIGSNPELLGEFGAAVALSGDLCVVGAPAHGFQGDAYVFLWNGTSWDEDARLLTTVGSSDSRFGHAVACDGTRVLVGMPYDSFGLADGGSCHLYRRLADGSYEYSERILAAEIDHLDLAGSSVALDGDRFAIGAPAQGTGFGNSRGGASVWRIGPPASLWYVDDTLIPAVGFNSEEVGLALDVSGDTLIAGAKHRENDRGAAHVFRRSGTVWVEEVTLEALDGAPNHEFGTTVAIEGDRAVVAGWFQSAIYVFGRSGTLWSEQARLDTSSLPLLVDALDLSGDTIVAGVTNNVSQDVGAAVVFALSGTQWIEQAVLTASDGTNFDRFGSDVAIDGDTVIVGARSDDPYGGNEGAVYVFERSGTTWSETQKLISLVPVSGGGLGSSVALDGDWAFAGSPDYDEAGGGNTGAVYVYRRTGGLFEQVDLLLPSLITGNDRFGTSVALDGSFAMVGAPHTTLQPSQDGAGVAYVFEPSGTTWVEAGRVQSRRPRFDAYFGSKVAVGAGLLAVSEPFTVESWVGAAPLHVLGRVDEWPSFCDASDGSLAACPCANPGGPDTGCDIAQGTGGLRLDVVAQETGAQNRATLAGAGYPPASAPGVTVLRSTGLDPASPVVFGDGLRCVGVPVVRVGATLGSGGTSVQTVGHGAGAGTGTFYYQLWVRNTPAMFCTPDAFNLSNGRAIAW